MVSHSDRFCVKCKKSKFYYKVAFLNCILNNIQLFLYLVFTTLLKKESHHEKYLRKKVIKLSLMKLR